MIAPVELTIVGAGAVGGLIGAHLWRAGHAVRLVDRERAHVTAIQADGLEIAGHADFVARLPACEPEAVTGSIHTLVLAVKTVHTREALAPLVPRLAPDGWVISMQNGLEEEKIAALVGEARTAAAFLSFGGHYERPGRVVYSGPGTLRVGELDGRLTPRVAELARILSDFHPASATGNIVGCRWGKLLLGTVYFATAMVDADVVDILDDAGARRVLSELVGEGLAVADALGITVEDVDGFDPRSLRGGECESAAARATWDAHRAYWRRSTAGRTGIWRDLAVRKRRTEAGPILGALIDAAERAGRPVPRVRAMLARYAELEAGAPRDWTNLLALGGPVGARRASVGRSSAPPPRR
jgi:2-dehydropantoate 2-reductase